MAVEPLLKVEMPDEAVAALYSMLVEFAVLRDQSGGRSSLIMDSTQVCVKAGEMIGADIPSAALPFVLSHALRHARQAIAGDALTRAAAERGVLRNSKPWQYDAKEARFSCDCVVFVSGTPMPCRFAIYFVDGSLRPSKTNFMAGRPN